MVSESDTDDVEIRIIELLKKGLYTSKKIIDVLKIAWSTGKVSGFLKAHDEVITVKGKPVKFTHQQYKIPSENTLF